MTPRPGVQLTKLPPFLCSGPPISSNGFGLHPGSLAARLAGLCQPSRKNQSELTLIVAGRNRRGALVMHPCQQRLLWPIFVQLDAGIADRLASQDLLKQIRYSAVNSCLFNPSIPAQAKCSSSRPNAVLVTPRPTDPKPKQTTHLTITSGLQEENGLQSKRLTASLFIK